MLRVLSFEESKVFDREVEGRGFSVETLMEVAGKGIYEAVKRRFTTKGLKVVVVAGKGNNGGDALVCARYLALDGADVKVYIPTYELKNLPAKQLERLKGLCSVDIFSDKMLYDIVSSDVVVDGVFGVGFSGKISGDYLKVIKFINHGKFVVSVDVPSGIDDKGNFDGVCVKANLTVCTGAMKTSVILYPGRRFAGEIEVANLGFPIPYNLGSLLVEEEDIINLIPKFLGNEHKGMFGRLVVFAGSERFPGALNLTLLGALRGGAGLIYAINRDINIIFPEVIPIKEINISPSAFAIGPGLTRERNILVEVKAILDKFPKVPTVLDADGLFVIKEYGEVLNRENVIITPHPGEFSAIFGGTAREIDINRLEVVRRFTKEYRCVLLLKGNPTVIGKDGKVFINPTGNISLAKGGSGDILTGLIGAFLSMGLEPLNAAILGAYIHGKAGDLYMWNRSVMITEIAEGIKRVIGKYACSGL